MSSINSPRVKRSRYTSISRNRYNETKPKTLEEIQRDEILKIKETNPELYNFFGVFANPHLSTLKTFDLKDKTQFKFDDGVFGPIKLQIINLFKRNLKDIRSLKISSELIGVIHEMKNGLIEELRTSQLVKGSSIFEKLKAYALKIKQKFLSKKNSQSQVQSVEIEFLTQIFSGIINILQGNEKSDINIAVIINKFFDVSIGEIFGFLPEFKRPPFSNLLKMRCRFNMLSLAVFLGIEPLIVFFILLGGDPSLTNQLHQDSSYQLLFFQMMFRNTAINVRWNPKDNPEQPYKDPRIQAKIESFDKVIKNMSNLSSDQSQSEEIKQLSLEFIKFLKNEERRLTSETRDQAKTLSANLSQNATIHQLISEIKSLRDKVQKLEHDTQINQFTKQQPQIQQQYQTSLQQPQTQQGQPQPQQQLQQLQLYNFNMYLFSNNKLRRILTFLSIIGSGIDLSKLVPQTDKAQFYISGNKQIIEERALSSVLISMAKDKYLNESTILIKYSIYDLLRYFLIFDGFDSSNFLRYLTRNTGYRNNTDNSSVSNGLDIMRMARGEQSLLLPKKTLKFISNINETSKPFDYSFFFYLIANKVILSNHKLELGRIALLQGADPNIMPDIAQNLLSQIDPNLKLCDIFKMFLGEKYEEVIRIFKLYSDLFEKAEWDDKLGNIQELLKKQKRNIEFLKRQRNTSQMSYDLRRRTNSNFPVFNPVSSIVTTVPVYNNPFQQFQGGNQIKLRTFHFLEPKTYNEHAFRAEKPIIAGKMAYDFLRTHYKLKKGSSIMFTIEDRNKDRKYNYIGEKVNNKIIIKST